MKKNYTISALALSVFSISINAQQIQPKNATYNASVKPTYYHQIARADSWSNANEGTADLFDKSSNARNVGIPENYMGSQDAVDGERYIGLFAGYAGEVSSLEAFAKNLMSDESTDAQYTPYTEYAQAELQETLKAGEEYKVTFKVSLADKSGRALAGLGAYFSDKAISQKGTGLLSVTPQISSDKVITDKTGWTEITGTFVASGTEKHIVIGVFKKGYKLEDITSRTEMDNKRAYYYIAGGISIQLNKKDSDKDGIVDENDACPTVFGLAEFKGCPDTDGDGVADKDDACPKVKGLVNLKGCPDTDGDGVADKDDKCPNVVGTISNKGCPEISESTKQVFQQALQGIQFETGKDVIKKTSFPILNQVVKIMQDNPTYLLYIAGHTDDVGDDAKNLTLSDKRAAAVKKYLTDKSIAENRLNSKGYGETTPVADNKTKEGRAKNRRVEFKVEF